MFACTWPTMPSTSTVRILFMMMTGEANGSIFFVNKQRLLHVLKIVIFLSPEIYLFFVDKNNNYLIGSFQPSTSIWSPWVMTHRRYGQILMMWSLRPSSQLIQYSNTTTTPASPTIQRAMPALRSWALMSCWTTGWSPGYWRWTFYWKT